MAAIPQFTQAQQAIAEMRAQLTPELKRRIITFTVASLVLGLLAVLLLALFGATYEPLTWTMLVLTGAAYGWFAHEELSRPIQSLPQCKTFQSLPQQWTYTTPWDDEEEAE